MIIPFVERYMTAWLFIGCIAGLIWPYWSWTSDSIVKAILIIATFIACFKLNLQEFKQLAWRQLGLMVLLRYTLVAWLVYWLASLVLPPDIALALLLIGSLPAGISSPAITHLFGGQVTLAATITIASTLIIPLTMPILFALASADTVMPDPTHLLQTLLVILVLPCIVFVFTRHIRPLKQAIDTGGKATVILLTALMLAMVVGQQRSYVLAEPELLLMMVGLTFIMLASMLLLGWLTGKRFARDQRIALATTSGFNNAALGVALAALHFSPTVIIVMVAAELSWALQPFVMRWLMGIRQ